MDFLQLLASFYQDFFVKPIETYSGYNPVNTLVYAAIMLFIAFVIVYPLFNRKGVKFNFKFALAVLPYILFGIALRLLEDMHILPRSSSPLEFGYYLISPGIWVLIGVSTIACLLIALFLARRLKREYTLIFGLLGLVLALPVFIFDLLYFQEFIGFLLVLAIVAAVALLAFKFVPKLLGSGLNRLAFTAQALDGAATFVAIQFLSCGEQHFLPKAIVNISPVLFLLAKLALVLAILYFLDKEIKDENLKGFIKLIIVILGFATGLRDLFTLAVGTCGMLF